MNFSIYVVARFVKSPKKPLKHIKYNKCLVNLPTLAANVLKANSFGGTSWGNFELQ